MKKLLVAVMSFTLVAFAAMPAAAQDSPVGSAGVASEPGAAVVLANRKQTKLTFDTATVLAVLPINAYVAIDAAKTLNCGTVTCLISAEITVQVGPNGFLNDCPIAMRFVVDGADQPGSNFFVNVLDGTENDFFFDNASTQITTNASKAAGLHTVQSFIGGFGGNACARRNYHHIQYSQSKP